MMKKRVGIVTIISKNYGNRLQNYALQTILERLNVEVETVPISKKEQAKMLLKILMYPFFKNRKWEWDEFNYKYIHWGKYNHTNIKLPDRYHYFIAGSDQIWNPFFYFNSEREFLVFAPPEKRIAYAASIGLYELPDLQTKYKYTTYWKEFKMISVREAAAAQIIRAAVDMEVPVVLDPTMLLPADEWNRLSECSKIKPGSKFVVCYFFEELDCGIFDVISKYAKYIGAEIIDIKPESIYKGYQIGPVEFLYLIQHSAYVFTNSFHGTALSIVFKRPFLVFHRKEQKGTGDMTSRIDTVLGMFGLKARYIKEGMDIGAILKDRMDYSEIELRMRDKRAEALDFLKHALELEE